MRFSDISSASGESVSDSQATDDMGKGLDSVALDNVKFVSPEEFKDSGVDVPLDERNVIGQEDGSPVVVQTGSGIKILAQVMHIFLQKRKQIHDRLFRFHKLMCVST